MLINLLKQCNNAVCCCSAESLTPASWFGEGPCRKKSSLDIIHFYMNLPVIPNETESRFLWDANCIWASADTYLSLSKHKKTTIFILTACSLFTGVAARETAQALRTLAQAARGVAASTKEPQAAAAMLDSAQYVMEGSAMLIHEAHQALVHPGDAESQQRLAQVAVIFVSHCSSQPTFHFLCLCWRVNISSVTIIRSEPFYFLSPLSLLGTLLSGVSE